MIPKFRAWDTHEEVMNRVGYIDFANGVVGLSNENVKDYEQPIHRVKFMQYTGLKDKNGVEIYEGDIVSVQNGEYIKPIIFSQGAFFAEDLFPYEIPYDCKVIGNKYENPELLKEQNK